MRSPKAEKDCIQGNFRENQIILILLKNKAKVNFGKKFETIGIVPELFPHMR